MGLNVNDLVVVGGLTSEKGVAMNGRFGTICSPISEESGRVGVLLYSIAGPDGAQRNVDERPEAGEGGGRAQVVALKPANLEPRPATCPVFYNFQSIRIVMAMQADRLGDAAGFIQHVIAAHPEDMPMMSTLANILRQRTPHEPGDVERAAELTRAVLADLPPDMEANRHRLQYDLAGSLLELDKQRSPMAAGANHQEPSTAGANQEAPWAAAANHEAPSAAAADQNAPSPAGAFGHLTEAFDVISGIDHVTEDPVVNPARDVARRKEALQLKVEMLRGLTNAIKYHTGLGVEEDQARLDFEEAVLRAEHALAPNKVLVNWNLGAVLCRGGRLEEGRGLHSSTSQLNVSTFCPMC